jgi:basic amino acid/polyamine antiporter, APA family
MNPQTQTSAQPALVKGLSLIDTVMLLVGGVIGSGIFLTAGTIAQSVRDPRMFILVWIAGGAISMLGCLAIAELGGMYPQAGGQYVFLREAYGELPAFLYGWMIFAVVQTGTIAALAVGFGIYFGAIFPAFGSSTPLLQIGTVAITIPKLVAVGAIALLTFANIVGLRRGSTIVNVATWLKFGAMGALIIFGLVLGHGQWSHFSQTASQPLNGSVAMATGFGVALISVLFAYDGWIYITWVAGEVKDAARNVPLALILGVVVIIGLYVLMNVVYLYALPIDHVMSTEAVVRDAADALFPSRLGTWLSVMVAVSVFGAMSSAILCTARIFYAMAQDGVFFRRMADVHPRYRTPAFALIAQGIWAACLAVIGLYDQLLTYAIFMMIVSYIASVGALFVLRKKQPDVPRPYRCAGYPFVPILYLVITAAWTLNTIWEKPMQSLGGLAIVLAGIPGYLYWTRNRSIQS